MISKESLAFVSKKTPSFLPKKKEKKTPWEQLESTFQCGKLSHLGVGGDMSSDQKHTIVTFPWILYLSNRDLYD